jgi:hypothetical protein
MAGPFPYLPWNNGPAAPACNVTVSWNGRKATVLALIDSGAGGTTIPAGIAKRLELAIRGKKEVSGATGAGKMVNEHIVDLNLLGFPFPNHVVWGLPDRSYALIGRDILNRYKATLDGPASEYSIE